MEINVIEEKPLSLTDINMLIDELKKRDKELNFRSTKVKNYLESFSLIDYKKAKQIEEKLKSLNITRLKDKYIVKIIDIMPKDNDSLKTIFVNEPIALKQEEIEKILEVIKENA